MTQPYAPSNVRLKGLVWCVLFCQRSVPTSSCVPAVCQLLCLLQQPAQCWNVPMQALYSHSLKSSSCSQTEREERSSYRRAASCFGLYHNDHCSFLSTLWGTRKQNVWHVALPFSATLVTADRLADSFLDVCCCCCGHWHHRICRWKKEECVKITEEENLSLHSQSLQTKWKARTTRKSQCFGG